MGRTLGEEYKQLEVMRVGTGSTETVEEWCGTEASLQVLVPCCSTRKQISAIRPVLALA